MSGEKKVFITVNENDLVVGGVAVLVTLSGEEAERGLRLVPIGDMTPWEKIGLLQAALDREKVRMSQNWQR